MGIELCETHKAATNTVVGVEEHKQNMLMDKKFSHSL